MGTPYWLHRQAMALTSAVLCGHTTASGKAAGWQDSSWPWWARMASLVDMRSPSRACSAASNGSQGEAVVMGVSRRTDTELSPTMNNVTVFIYNAYVTTRVAVVKPASRPGARRLA